VLIPKASENITIDKFRPISLINCSLKIITKFLANRLSSVIDTLIDFSQIIFIKDKNIHDNIICAQKILFKVEKVKQNVFF
jgi:Reverse transcriptase (RNA-dependent DNA polymerase)